MLELVIYERDYKGNITNKQISVQSSKGYDLYKFFHKNVPPVKSKGKAASRKEAEKIQRDLNSEDN